MKKKKTEECNGFNNNNCPNWHYIEKKTDNSPLEMYLFNYLDNEVEKVYEWYKVMNKNNIDIRKKKNKMSKTFKFLMKCLPVDIEMVAMEKPKDKTKLMKWKGELEDVSKLCFENSKKLFKEANCKGNYTKTSIQSAQNYKLIESFLSKGDVNNEK